MKKIVLTYGLIAGTIMSVMLMITLPLHDQLGDGAIVVGYASMVAAFLLVFFGIRSYRDHVAGGYVSFGRAFSVGMLIVLLSSTMYVATWEVLYYTVHTDYLEKYQRTELAKARTEGKSDAEIAALAAEMDRFAESYRNPLFNVAVSFAEPLPVGLIVTLVSAGILRRRRRDEDAALAAA